MPILITPPAPLETTALLPVTSLYAIIERVSYTRRGLVPKTLQFEVSYYANEAASVNTTATSLELNGLPTNFNQEASPEQANALPLFDFLETLLKTRLEAFLPVGTLIEKVV